MRPVKIMTFETFAAQNGASRQDIGDVALQNPAGHVPRHTWDRMVAAQRAHDQALIARRAELRIEFDRLVAEGHIREPTTEERMRAAAAGEGARAEAAKRVLAKMAQRRNPTEGGARE